LRDAAMQSRPFDEFDRKTAATANGNMHSTSFKAAEDSSSIGHLRSENHHRKTTIALWDLLIALWDSTDFRSTHKASNSNVFLDFHENFHFPPLCNVEDETLSWRRSDSHQAHDNRQLEAT
jgi:hypothetical protein